MANKITKREIINKMLEDENIKNVPLYTDYLSHELELLDNKKSNKKETAKQIENKGYKEEIVKYLKDNGKSNISEIQKGVASLTDLTNQKVTSLITPLINEGVIIRIEEKRKPYYQAKD